MKAEAVKLYCRSKWKAYEDFPFGESPVCYKLNGKIFAQVYPMEKDYKVTLKCTSDAGLFYREIYPEAVVRGYHCPPVQQPYWNTVYPDRLPEEEVLNMIEHAYDTVLHSFSKKIQKQILAADDVRIREMKKEEYVLLEDFLYDAIYQPEDLERLPRGVVHQPDLEIYINDFGNADDICLAAESEGIILGAVWTRVLSGESKGYGYLDENTPELAISVKKDFRSQGIGRKLMMEIITIIRERDYKRISLSVDRKNAAFQFYQKLGFQVMKEKDDSVIMVLAF